MKAALTLLRWELYKVIKRPGSYVGFLLCILFVVVVLVVFSISKHLPMERTARGLTLDPSSILNGYFFVTFILYFGHKALLPLLAGIIPGAQIAGEAKDGTLRAMLTRPPSRLLLFGIKLLVSYLWLLASVYFLMLFALIVGYIFMGGGDFLVFVWEFRHYGPWFADSGDWLAMFLLTGFGASVGLFMIVAFSLSLSALTDNPVVAYVGAIGFYFISSIVQRLPEQLLHPLVREALPTFHTSFWHEFYWLFHPTEDHFDAGRMISDLKWCAMYTVIFLSVGLFVFLRKDIKA